MRPCVARATGLTVPPSPAPTRGFSFPTPLPFSRGTPLITISMMPPGNPWGELRRIYLPETVWKLSRRGLDEARSLACEAKMRPLSPSMPAHVATFGAHRDFPDSLSTHLGE